jgi:hypothetical protein
MKYLLDEAEMADLVKRKDFNAQTEALEQARVAILDANKAVCRNTLVTSEVYRGSPVIRGGYCGDCPVFKVYGHRNIDIGCKLPKEWSK